MVYKSIYLGSDVFFLCVFVFLKGRAGADGGRGEIGEVGAKVQQKKA